MHPLRAAAMFGILLGSVARGAEVYQWEDQSGGVHFTDSIERVPQEQRRRVIRREVDPVPSYPRTPSPPESRAPQPGEDTASSPVSSPTGAGGGEGLEQRLTVLEEERRRAAEEVQLAHRRYVTSLGSRDPSKPQALNTVTFRRKEYQDARARLESIERQIEELKKGLSPP